MPVVRYSTSYDDTFHHRAESQSPEKANSRYSRQILPSHQPLRRRRNHLSIDTQDVSNGEFRLVDVRYCHPLMFCIYLSDHLISPRRRASSNEDYANQHLQDTPTDSTDGQYHHGTQPGETNPTQYHSSTMLESQERFDQEVMVYYHAIDSSLASQFLNLDDETWPCTDQTVTPELGSLTAPSSSLQSVSTEDTPEWDVEPSSFHLFDMKRFETATDLDGGKKTTPWPWGDYKYRPPTPPRYLDPEAYVAEFELAEIEKSLQEKLTETMAQEAILDGVRRTATKRKVEGERREKRKKMRVGRGDGQPPTVAFNNQVVRGRTIYNP